MEDALQNSIHDLAHDMFAMKLYWVAISTLWFYDYFLTLDDEINYAWTGKKTPVFWLFLLNRYLCPAFIIITLVAYFADSFTMEVCARYGFFETLQTMLLTCTAELFLTLRVFALTKKHKAVPIIAGIILAWQWGIALYAMSQSSKGSDNPALLLSRRDLPPLPPLPDIDPFHICIFISTLAVTPWVEAFLCLSLAFDIMAFIAILYITLKATKSYHFMRTMKVIQRDGIIYFFVLFSSNLIWLLLVIHAKPGLKFMHHQPAMVVSAIMINRITLNLKRSASGKDTSAWSVATFQHLDTEDEARRLAPSMRYLSHTRQPSSVHMYHSRQPSAAQNNHSRAPSVVHITRTPSPYPPDHSREPSPFQLFQPQRHPDLEMQQQQVQGIRVEQHVSMWK